MRDEAGKVESVKRCDVFKKQRSRREKDEKERSSLVSFSLIKSSPVVMTVNGEGDGRGGKKERRKSIREGNGEKRKTRRELNQSKKEIESGSKQQLKTRRTGYSGI